MTGSARQRLWHLLSSALDVRTTRLLLALGSCSRFSVHTACAADVLAGLE